MWNFQHHDLWILLSLSEKFIIAFVRLGQLPNVFPIERRRFHRAPNVAFFSRVAALLIRLIRRIYAFLCAFFVICKVLIHFKRLSSPTSVLWFLGTPRFLLFTHKYVIWQLFVLISKFGRSSYETRYLIWSASFQNCIFERVHFCGSWGWMFFDCDFWRWLISIIGVGVVSFSKIFMPIGVCGSLLLFRTSLLLFSAFFKSWALTCYRCYRCLRLDLWLLCCRLEFFEALWETQWRNFSHYWIKLGFLSSLQLLSKGATVCNADWFVTFDSLVLTLPWTVSFAGLRSDLRRTCTANSHIISCIFLVLLRKYWR